MPRASRSALGPCSLQSGWTRGALLATRATRRTDGDETSCGWETMGAKRTASGQAWRRGRPRDLRRRDLRRRGARRYQQAPRARVRQQPPARALPATRATLEYQGSDGNARLAKEWKRSRREWWALEGNGGCLLARKGMEGLVARLTAKRARKEEQPRSGEHVWDPPPDCNR